MFLLLAGSLTLLGCGGSWVVKDPGAAQPQAGYAPVVTIERAEARSSPRIKTFEHLDLGISKESAGSRKNTAWARSRVESSPGTMRIGVVLPDHVRTYYPEVEFTATTGGSHLVTWLCVPYPIVAIVNTESSQIIATDSYSPECTKLHGEALSSDSECVLPSVHPPWMSPDERWHWLP